MQDAAIDPVRLRRRLLARRRALQPQQLYRAGDSAARLLWRQPEIQRARRIALYVAHRGELPCDAICRRALARRRSVYLPVLWRGQLRFAPYQQGQRMRRNRYRIPEPLVARRRLLRPAELDIVVVPLVACDSRGTRLGMGGGYYDRSLRARRLPRRWRRPLLIGLGYEFQRTEQLARRAWDIPIDALLTEENFYRFRRDGNDPSGAC